MARSIHLQARLIVFAGLLVTGTSWGADSVPEGYRTIAKERGIPYTVFYAVALTESGRRVAPVEVYRPWPWTLNVAGRGYFFDSRLEAWQALTDWLQAGRRSIDIGLMILVHALVTKKDAIKQDSMLGCRSGLLIDRVRRCV
ncbi:MAG: hypothetical protein GY896_00875 [Gammaproteobacteria bacterium]|nr:hypothetical protein [Gammaproteobacteria bacterium]